MTLSRRVAWNTGAQALARTVTLALSVVTTSLLTRHLGVSGYGVYVTVTVYLPFFVLFFDIGLTTYVVRSLSTRAASGDLFREAIGLRLALAVPVTVLALALAALLYGGEDDATTRNAIAIGLPMILFVTVTSATSALFQARLQMDRVALSEVVGQLAATALIVAVVVSGVSIYAVVAATVVGTFVNAALLLVLARRIEPVRPAVAPRRWAVLLRRALPLGLALMIATADFPAGPLPLSPPKDSDPVGLHGRPDRPVAGGVALARVLCISIF